VFNAPGTTEIYSLSDTRSRHSALTISAGQPGHGPLCGLLLGDADLVQRLRRDPFARALRVDKLTLAALEATVRGPLPPVLESLAARPEDLLARARRLAASLGADLAEAVVSEAAVGGGGAPGVVLPSAAVALPARLAEPLRHGEPPVMGRVVDGRLLLDLVAVPPERDDDLAEAVRRAAKVQH
jgi:L-seryl-tRNA(Ser) seleniumtransferase